VVGQITFAGTAELIVFAGVAGGLMAGTVWVLVREWLPQQAGQRIPLAGLLAACTGSQAVIAHNRDFHILNPVELHIVMFVMLAALTGLTTAALDRWLDRRLPRGDVAGALYGGLAAFGLVFALPVMVFELVLDGGSRLPQWPSGVALLSVTIATTLGWAGFYSRGEDAIGSRPRWQLRLGQAGVLLFGLIGALQLAAEVEALT
jgi:hypothetical protein